MYAVSMSPLIRAAHLAFTRSVTAARFASGEDSLVSPPNPAHPRHRDGQHDRRDRRRALAPREHRVPSLNRSPKHCQIIWIASKKFCAAMRCSEDRMPCCPSRPTCPAARQSSIQSLTTGSPSVNRGFWDFFGLNFPLHASNMVLSWFGDVFLSPDGDSPTKLSFIFRRLPVISEVEAPEAKMGHSTSAERASAAPVPAGSASRSRAGRRRSCRRSSPSAGAGRR